MAMGRLSDREKVARSGSHLAVALAPGRYFRGLFVGQFEGLASEREIAWRCAASLSLHRFLKLTEGETAPDHSTLSVTRSRLPLEHAVFGFILGIADRHA